MKRRLLLVLTATVLVVLIVVIKRTAADIAGFRVLSPSEGQVFAPGDTVHVVSESSEELEFVAVTVGGQAFVEGESPNDVALQLPDDIVGPAVVKVGAKSRAGGKAAASVNILIEPDPSTIVALEVPDVVNMGVGIEQKVRVFAALSNGRRINIAISTLVGVTSLTPAVVSVQIDLGKKRLILKGMDYGVGNVQVRVGDALSKNVKVSVGINPLRGDLNGDGIIDKGDEEIIRAAFGRPANPEDPRDLNGDGVIDKLDLGVLKSLTCGARPNSSLIPDGKPGTGCFVEWSLAGEALAKPPKCVPLEKQSCVDGAPCDADGEADGMCTFSMRLTLNTSDERLPECTSTQINGYTLVKPSESDAATYPEDDANRMGILNALAGMGVLPIVGAVYTEEFTIGVPLKRGSKGLKKGKKNLKLVAYGENGAKDVNKLKLTCLPNGVSGGGTMATPTPTPTATAGCQYVFVSKWGSQGSADGEFNEPYHVGVDAETNVYVADSVNHRIQKFTSTGTFLTKWGTLGTGNGQFNLPLGVAAGAGHVYVGDMLNRHVHKFTPSGTFVLMWGSDGSGDGQFSQPRGVALDSNGRVYVADKENHRVQLFDATGVFIRKTGIPGVADGEMFGPRAVATDGLGNLYVADTGNNRVQKFDSTGAFVTKWGGTGGSGDGQLTGPQGIAVDAVGDVYVADSTNRRIQKFDGAGTFITKWGTFGSGDGQFNVPTGIAVDSSGSVYVADAGNNRIEKFACQ